MAINPMLAAGPGPSGTANQKGKNQKKRVVEYDSSSEAEEDQPPLAAYRQHHSDPDGFNGAGPSSPQSHKRQADGEALGSSKKSKRDRGGDGDRDAAQPKQNGVNGVNGIKGKGKGKGKAKEDEQLAAEAERLLETRKSLPFYQGRREILEEIMQNDTTIILGETGCGKSTQLPQLLHRHPLSLASFGSSSSSSSSSSSTLSAGRAPRIGITQPRRLPAIALATRVAAEMGCRVGDEVGYTVRFEDCSDVRRTGVRYLTEGVLMRELANGGTQSETSDGLNLLLRYDVLVIDEAHERTLNTDFLCGALKKVQRIRKELAERGVTVGQLKRGEVAKGAGSVNGAGTAASTSNGQSSDVKGDGRVITPLKLVIMSATLDPSKFVNFFQTNRPALMVKGRMYDVSTQHLLSPVDDYIEAAAKQVMTIHLSPASVVDGDVLVFMPGAEEIQMCADILKRALGELHQARDGAEGVKTLGAEKANGHWVGNGSNKALSQMQEILPLYAQLPPSAQAAIFKPRQAGTRRVVIATNIAETSMTIPGVSYVVDTGFKKEKEYIYRSSGSIEHLRLKNVSKAAAWQRTGRAGRERAGHCYRLFTQKAFDDMINFDAPEIQRCNLAAAVLQLIAMGQNPFEFEYIDSPGRDPIMAAFQTLAGLEAISSPTTITPLGRQMLLYPLDPTHARVLIASLSPNSGCVSEIIDILSLGDAGPVWVDKQNERELSAAAKGKFVSRDGDHLTGMNVLRAYLELKGASQNGGNGKGVGKWAKENYVNLKTLNSALKVRQQLRELVQRHGHDPEVSAGGDMERVRRCLLMGMFVNTAVIQSDGTYRQSAGSLTVKIHPSSVLMSKKVPAIMYDELTITSAMYARNVSTFDQSWLLEIPWFRQAAAAKGQVA